jgi:steroid delta-isomerase-like uncharacterized protein
MQTDDIQMLVNQWIAAFNNHNVTAIVALYADDAELFDSGMKHPRHGCAEIEQWFTSRFQTMPTFSYTPTNQLFGQDQAVVTWTARAHSPRLLGQSWLSRPFQVDGVSVFSLRDGFIQKQRGYYDHLSALEQILPFLRWVLPARL